VPQYRSYMSITTMQQLTSSSCGPMSTQLKVMEYENRRKVGKALFHQDPGGKAIIRIIVCETLFFKTEDLKKRRGGPTFEVSQCLNMSVGPVVRSSQDAISADAPTGIAKHLLSLHTAVEKTEICSSVHFDAPYSQFPRLEDNMERLPHKPTAYAWRCDPVLPTSKGKQRRGGFQLDAGLEVGYCDSNCTGTVPKNEIILSTFHSYVTLLQIRCRRSPGTRTCASRTEARAPQTPGRRRGCQQVDYSATGQPGQYRRLCLEGKSFRLPRSCRPCRR
jgi:hypothetical protein